MERVRVQVGVEDVLREMREEEKRKEGGNGSTGKGRRNAGTGKRE